VGEGLRYLMDGRRKERRRNGGLRQTEKVKPGFLEEKKNRCTSRRKWEWELFPRAYALGVADVRGKEAALFDAHNCARKKRKRCRQGGGRTPSTNNGRREKK